jgi:hypothetical protein
MAQNALDHRHSGPTLLIASDACRRLGHQFANRPRDEGHSGLEVCVTCTEQWGHLKGLRDWQENCPCCFSTAHPNGLTDLGITAELKPTAPLARRSSQSD